MDAPWPRTTLDGTDDDNIMRTDAIDYHELDKFVIGMGAILDIVNVRGSSGMCETILNEFSMIAKCSLTNTFLV